jgi:prepilin-type N-terminal cleavage/methylation domain-containing protein
MKKLFNQHSGFTLVETMIVVAILSFLIAATYGIFLSGQSIWNRTDTSIELDEQLTKAANRVTAELRQSGHDAKGKFQIFNSSQSGANQSDVFKFSIPVICENGGNPVDANGDTAHWGAPLTWGCSKASCMDENNNCDTVEYKFIQYLINEKHQLLRRVLDFSENTTKEEVIAQDISAMRLEPNFDERMVKLFLTAEKEIGRKRTAKQELQINIRLRNAK